MSPKRKKSKQGGQFPKGSKPESPAVSAANEAVTSMPSALPSPSVSLVQPEHMSLTAHAHIIDYLEKFSKGTKTLEDSEIVSILQLSQHLRMFGLLSAAGFVKQTNQQGGEVQKKRRQVWELLLCKLLGSSEVSDAKTLMEAIVKMTSDRPAEYMALWRRATVLSKHWNFWARAYQIEIPSKDSHGETI